MTLTDDVRQALSDLLGKDAPVLKHAEEARAKREAEAYRALGVDMAREERERDERLPALNKAHDTAFTKLKKKREEVAAAEQEYNAAMRDRNSFLHSIEHRLHQLRIRIRPFASPKIKATIHEIDTLLERWRSGPATPYRTDTKQMYRGMHQVDVCVASNYEAVQRRFAALAVARHEIDALADRYIEDIDGEIAAIIARVPNGLDFETPVEPIKGATAGLSAA